MLILTKEVKYEEGPSFDFCSVFGLRPRDFAKRGGVKG
jgi:hypothetical protein